jgi:geranylgeranyl diphosphate synthase type II
MATILKRAPNGAALDLQRFAELRASVDARLETFFPTDGEEPSRLVCAIRHGLLSPGKRLRPIITLLACEQLNGETANALDAACAIEMVHAASLVMDDLPAMDNARLRRGCLSTHIVFGEGAGMLAAIALLNEAYRLIGACEAMPEAKRLAAIAHLTHAIGPDGLAGGQERDIMCGRSAAAKLTLSDMERRHAEKTGALFAAAAAIGGEIAGAAQQDVEAMREYGYAIGLAYQAFDDVLDQTATTGDAGKDTGKDEGKTTVVSLLGREGAKAAGARWLKRASSIAEETCAYSPAPLAGLAGLIGAKFNVSIA